MTGASDIGPDGAAGPSILSGSGSCGGGDATGSFWESTGASATNCCCFGCFIGCDLDESRNTGSGLGVERGGSGLGSSCGLGVAIMLTNTTACFGGEINFWLHRT